MLEEKEGYMKLLFDQFREQEANIRQGKKVSHCDVETALLEKMGYLSSSIQEIKGMSTGHQL